MNILNANTLILFAGLVALAISIVISLVEFQRLHYHASVVNVGLALVACALVVAGLFQLSFPLLTDTTALIIVVAGAIIATAIGIGMFLTERARDGFNPSMSPGLLYAGVGVFTLIVALVIPAMPMQLTAKAIALRPVSTSVSTVTRASTIALRGDTSTPTNTATATVTPTDLPTLTLTPSDTPVITSTLPPELDPVENTPIACTLTSTTMLTIRPDPSLKQQSIGRVLQGMTVIGTGLSEDQKWWRIIFNDPSNNTAINGWVAAAYVIPSGGCTPDVIPVVQITNTPSRTPLPSRTPYPTRTKRSNVETQTAQAQ